MSGCAQLIREQAKNWGFNRVRFCDAQGAPGIEAYDNFLSSGLHGDMAWMERSQPPRANPRLLLPDAKSAVVLGMDYAWPMPPDPGGLTGKVSRYAWGRDYHNLIGKRLRKFARDLRLEIPGLNLYWGVDSRPLIERAWAERAGLGFVGKNGCAIVPGQTSWFFLAVMLVNIPLPPDPPLKNHCGKCVRCIEDCPTDAFIKPGQIDARRCISYLTIEHKGSIPRQFRTPIGRWVFGCDVCQSVCPHNHVFLSSEEADFRPRNAWLDLEWMLKTDDDTLTTHFHGSPIRRPGSVGLKRNAALVLGNLNDPAGRPALKIAIEHPSDVVKEAARWALDQL